MKIEWQDIDDEDVTGWDYYGMDAPKPKRVKHLIAVEIEEEVDESNSMLVQSIINAFDKEIGDMRRLLAKTTGAKVTHHRRSTAGRYELKIRDNGSPVDLSVNHHLVTRAAEEPGLGWWADDFDWEVEHPDACTPEAQFDNLCPFIEEVDYSGRDAFGDPSDWPKPPFRMRIRHVVHETPAGPWGGPEYDIYIEQDPEEPK